MRYDDIDPMDIDPETNLPYANYSSPCLDTSFHDHEMDVDGPCTCNKPWCEDCAVANARDLRKARDRFINAYLNTGCDDEEADQHADALGFTKPEQFDHEALRYEDM